MNSILTSITKQLPLRITFVSWDRAILTISNTNWSFSTISAWRLVRGQKVVYGCWDKNSDRIIECLKNEQLIGCGVGNISLPIDPIFHFSNKVSLEIFTCETFEPWVLKLPNDQIFVGALD